MAIGCIQAQRCHTNHCFAGVANPSSVVGAWSGSNEQSRAVRQLHHHAAEGRAGAESCVPGSASGAHYRGHWSFSTTGFGSKTIAELFGYGRGFGLPSPTNCEEVRRIMKL